MKAGTRKYRQASVGKMLLSISLILLLVFLTSVNYFLYSSSNTSTVTVASTDNGNDESPRDLPNSPAGPDEKSPDTPVSITEEYVHEHENPINPLWMNAMFQHMVHETEKLRVVHFELLSPPPEA